MIWANNFTIEHSESIRERGPWGCDMVLLDFLLSLDYRCLGLNRYIEVWGVKLIFFRKNMYCVWFLPCWPSSENSGLGHLQYRIFGRRACCARLCCELMFDRQTKRCCACHSFSHSQTILLWTRLKPSYVYIYVHAYTCSTDWQIAIGQSLHSPADVRWPAKSVYLFVLLTWSTEIETISLVYLCSFCP